MRVVVVIPALDEADSIGVVVTSIVDAATRAGHHASAIVADNGSHDDTGAVARTAGAHVVVENERGYGAACLRALASLPASTDAVLFADGDGADDPDDVSLLLAPIADGRADMVIGSRALGERMGLVEHGAMTTAQRFGNALATTLLRVGYAHHATDLGPFRAVTVDALTRMRMDDRNFGWTVQMQARAALLKLRVAEIPVHYRRRRTGRSKVSGDVRASMKAGAVILGTLAREAFRSS